MPAFGCIVGHCGCVQGVGALDAGILTFLFGHDPRFEDDSAIAVVDEDSQADQPSFWGLLEELGIVCTIPTFLIIVFQVN